MDTVTIESIYPSTLHSGKRFALVICYSIKSISKRRYLKTAISKLRCSYNYWFYEVTLMATTLRFVEVEREQCSYQGGL